MLFALALMSSVAMAQNSKPDKVISIVCNETTLGQVIDKDGNAQKIEKSISGSTAVRKIYFQADGSRTYTLTGKDFYNGAANMTYKSHGTIRIKKISANIRQRIKDSSLQEQLVDPNVTFSSNHKNSRETQMKTVETIETKADGSDVFTQQTLNGKVQPVFTNFTITGADGVKYSVEFGDQPYVQTDKDGSKYKLISYKSVCTETPVKPAAETD